MPNQYVDKVSIMIEWLVQVYDKDVNVTSYYPDDGEIVPIIMEKIKCNNYHRRQHH